MITDTMRIARQLKHHAHMQNQHAEKALHLSVQIMNLEAVDAAGIRNPEVAKLPKMRADFDRLLSTWRSELRAICDLIREEL